MSAGACCTAPAVVDQYLLPSGNSAANLLQITGAMSEWDRHIDPQADADRYIILTLLCILCGQHQ